SKVRGDFFFSYFHSYKKCYFDILWHLEESDLLLRTGNHTKYNAWQLNCSLYQYAESSISSLFWIYGEGKEHPFAHQFLRRWRNKYHHHAKVDLGVYDFSYTVDGQTTSVENDYFILPNIISNDQLSDWVARWFPDEKIVTDATVCGLVRYHHVYMSQVFREKELEMQELFPEKFLVNSTIEKRLLCGGNYTRFVSEDAFWKHSKCQS
ncbi:hypothetical protein BVX99_00070, partial [bacterium F16]